MTEIERWRNARLYALKHSCDEAMACDYADHVLDLIARREITLPAAHAPMFTAWMRENDRMPV